MEGKFRFLALTKFASTFLFLRRWFFFEVLMMEEMFNTDS